MLRLQKAQQLFMRRNNYDHLTYEQKRAVIEALERRKERLIRMFETEKFMDDVYRCFNGGKDPWDSLY